LSECNTFITINFVIIFTNFEKIFHLYFEKIYIQIRWTAILMTLSVRGVTIVNSRLLFHTIDNIADSWDSYRLFR